MVLKAITHSENPQLAESSVWIENTVWPEYNRHADVVGRYWPRLTTDFPDFQFVVFDEASNEVVARGNTVPFHWDGDSHHLPRSMDALVMRAFERKGRGSRPNALSALAAEVPPQNRAKGLGTFLLLTMKGIAQARGLEALVAPVRPVWKERYPLTPIEQYMTWKRSDGLPFDPWIRLHHGLGARFIKPAPRSLRITGTVAEWESWTQMPFPASGRYVFPRGLAPLRIDRGADTGLYWEPNVWMSHPVP
ncbi:MAG: hypothetical protein M3164_05525 [Actinomycetota bacterium]|nr:hypothetical protein [Actinomycetota bacterium]